MIYMDTSELKGFIWTLRSIYNLYGYSGAYMIYVDSDHIRQHTVYLLYDYSSGFGYNCF